MAQIVEPARCRLLAAIEPFLARLATLPVAGGEAQNFDLHAAAFQRARQDVGAHRRDRDRPAAHRSGIVDQQGDDGVAEVGFALALIGLAVERLHHHTGQFGTVQQAFVQVEFPAT